MKKFFYYLTAFSVCLSAFTSCEEDDDDDKKDNTNNVEKTVKFNGVLELSAFNISTEGVAEIEFEGNTVDIEIPIQGISIDDVNVSTSGDTIYYSAENAEFESDFAEEDGLAHVSGFSVGDSVIYLKFDVSAMIEGKNFSSILFFSSKSKEDTEDSKSENNNEETEDSKNENIDEFSIFGTYSGAYEFNSISNEKSVIISEVNADSICIDLGKMKFSENMPFEVEIKFNVAYSKKDDGTYIIEKQTVVLDEKMNITADVEGSQNGKIFNVNMIAHVFDKEHPLNYSGSKF